MKSVEASKVETVLGEKAHRALEVARMNAAHVWAGYGLTTPNSELAGRRRPNAQSN